MLTRKQQIDKRNVAASRLPSDVRAARKQLRTKGWSYRRAAPELGVHFVHLSQVLNGHRQSRRLISAISELPDLD